MEITTRESEDVLIITVSGSLEGTAGEDLKEFVKTQLDEGVRNFVLDMEKVTRMDSSNFGQVGVMLHDIKSTGGCAAFIKVATGVRSSLVMSRLVAPVEIFFTEAEAVAALAGYFIIREVEDGNVLVVDVQHRLVGSERPSQLYHVLEQRIDLGQKYIVLNFTALSDDSNPLDASGLGVILGIRNKLQRMSGDIALLSIPEKVQTFLTQSKLSLLFLVYDIEEEAVTGVQFGVITGN